MVQRFINLLCKYFLTGMKIIFYYKLIFIFEGKNEYGSDIWSETSAPYVSYKGTSKIIVKTNILPILRMP